MGYNMRPLTQAEKEEFLKKNYWGILSFVGSEPYAIPMGYQYIKGDILLGFSPKGRKTEYVNKSRSICFVVCQPSKLSPNSSEAYPYNTVVIEGELEDVTDRAYYELPPLPEDYKDSMAFRIKEKSVGTQELSWT